MKIIMSRYLTNNILQDRNGLRRLSSTIIPIIPISSTDTYIQTTSIERLDKLASTFYGDSSLWWVIASANALGKGSIIVPPNSKLRIPTKNNIQQIINNINIIR
jgi:hypothetical protein